MRYERLYQLMDQVAAEIVDFQKYPLPPQPVFGLFWDFVTKDIRGRKEPGWAEVPQDIVDRFKPIMDWYQRSLETIAKE
jgi:hypothetical protein